MITSGMNYCAGCVGGHGSGNTQTYVVGRVYIAVVASAGFPPANVAAGGNLFTLASQMIVGGNRYLGVYTYAPLTTHTGAFWFEYSPNGSCGDYQRGYEIAGVPNGTNGAVAIRQIATNSGTSADPSITMAPLNPANAVMAFFINDAGTFTGTPESPFTTLWDEACGVYPFSTYAMQNLNGSDNTPTVTAASSGWAGIAIELRLNRRVSIA